MVMLVTLQQASDHLRRDTTDDDNDLTLKISGASRAVLNYLKNDMLAYEFEADETGQPILDSSGDIVYLLDSSGDYISRPEVQQAVLIMIGVMYADRQAVQYIDGESEPRLGNMSLPKTVHWLLDPIRKPTLS